MPANPKPADLFRWADSGGAIATPPAGVKDIGWVVDQEVPAEYANYLDNGAYQWFAYLDTLTDNALTWSAAQRFTLAARFDAGLDTYGGIFDKGTTDAQALLNDTIAPSSTWRLVAAFKLTAGSIYARTYTSSGSVAEMRTINAAWDEGTAKWVADAAGTDAYGLLLSPTGEQLMRKAAAANWASWDSTSTATATGTNTRTFDGPVAAGGVVTVGDHVSATTAPMTAVVAGTVAGDMVTVGWATVVNSLGTYVIGRGTNVKTYTRTGAGRFTIVFQPVVTDPANAAAVVTIGFSGATDYGIVALTSDDGTGRIQVDIEIDHLTTPGGAGNLTKTATDKPFTLHVAAAR